MWPSFDRLRRELDTSMAKSRTKFWPTVFGLFKQTASEWMADKAPQLGAALAYYTVFSLAPLVLILLALVGLIFRHDPTGAWNGLVKQMSYFLDQNAVRVIQEIAQNTSHGPKSIAATVAGVALALFGASGVFGQLQDALNTIWGVKAKPGANFREFLRARFLSFAMVAGMCFLLLVSLVVEAILQAIVGTLPEIIPGGGTLALTTYFLFDLSVVGFFFAMIFKFLPDAIIKWRDVWIGAALTSLFFLVGKWALGLYLGSGAAASVYGAASSLITLLLWIYYSAQILLFGAEFTQVYSDRFGSKVKPTEYAVRV
ncbi:MAG: rane protein [Verrucomicrobiota bacterium]